jgi:hypothetical protein
MPAGTTYHLLPGYRVRVADHSTYDHWQGGPASHDGADCRACRRPLLLLWDLNCGDPRFRVNGRPVFHNVRRLPLYYCWTCGGEIDYRVTSPNRVRALKNTGKPQGRNFPYKRYPKAFERRPIELDRLADMPEKAKALLGAPWIERLPARSKGPLERWIERPLKYGFDIWWHQFGGLPWLVQGPERIVCPHKECSWSRRHRGMKVLATVQNDPPGGLPMIESADEVQKSGGHFNWSVQVIFHICKGCLTIHAGNRCD